MKKATRFGKEVPDDFWAFFREDMEHHKEIASRDDLKERIDYWAKTRVQKPVLEKGEEESGLDLTF